MNHILIIEDDKTLSDGIVLALKSSDIHFHQAFGVHEAKKEMDAAEIQLILLDVNLPDGSGLEFGADDYITKPFSLAVLRAWVNTQLRRIKALSPELISIGNFLLGTVFSPVRS